MENPRFLTSTGVGLRHIPAPPEQDTVPQLTRHTQLERWWSGGGALGPSEYGANFGPQGGTLPRRDLGVRLSPGLLRPATLEHFRGAGYAKRMRSPASAIFPGRLEPWCSETQRSFPPLDLERLLSPGGLCRPEQLSLWQAEMYPRAWGFGRQDTWSCPPYLRESVPRDRAKFPGHVLSRNLPTLVLRPPNRGMQSEFQASYRGAPSSCSALEVHGVSCGTLPPLLPAPSMYAPESHTYGSGRPTTAWV